MRLWSRINLFWALWRLKSLSFAGGLALLPCLALLAGCNQMADSPQATTPRERPKINLQHADVAFVSIDGPPEALSLHILERVRAQAGAHNIGQAPDYQAHYLLRGYVTAYPDSDGVALATVWDVFNASKQRIKRLDNNFMAKGAGDNVWAVLDEEAIEHLSAQMVDDLEDYLDQEAQSPSAPFAEEAKAPSP